MSRIILGYLTAFALFACSSAPAVYDGKVARRSVEDFDEAPRAVFANQIPVCPGVKLDDAMGSKSWGDEADSYSEGMTWSFEFPAAERDRVIAFYETALPGVERTTDEDGDVVWEFPPAGAKEKESVSVRVRAAELWISEDVYGNRDERIRNASAGS
jgi:hypothetical protein